MIIAEYIWIDGKNKLRSKTRVIHEFLKTINEKTLPQWNYDGSSTNQAETENSEIILKPVYICNDPFRKNKYINKLVLCDTWTTQDNPYENNTRPQAKEIFEKYKKEKPMFGLEQEFFLSFQSRVLQEMKNYNYNGENEDNENFYCTTNQDTGRECFEEVLQKCLEAGLKLTGGNAEVAAYQWEFQLCTYGIECSDELHILRYIIGKVANSHGFKMNLEPKPLKNENGSGCHVNFSTEEMRNKNSEELTNKYIKKLENKHHVLLIIGLHYFHCCGLANGVSNLSIR